MITHGALECDCVERAAFLLRERLKFLPMFVWGARRHERVGERAYLTENFGRHGASSVRLDATPDVRRAAYT